MRSGELWIPCSSPSPSSSTFPSSTPSLNTRFSSCSGDSSPSHSSVGEDPKLQLSQDEDPLSLLSPLLEREAKSEKSGNSGKEKPSPCLEVWPREEDGPESRGGEGTRLNDISLNRCI